MAHSHLATSHQTTLSDDRRLRQIAEQVRLSAALELHFARQLAIELNRYAHAMAASYAIDGEQMFEPLTAAHHSNVAALLRAHLSSVATSFGRRLLGATRAHLTAAHFKRTELDTEAEIEAFLLKHVLRRSENISAQTRKQIARAIADGLRDELTTAEISALIVERTGGEIALKRARTIAATEVHTVANASSHEAAKATELKLEKEWASAEDSRVRPTHVIADGQRVKLKKRFLVGGARLMYPGDPSGPPREIINCRCVLIYHELD